MMHYLKKKVKRGSFFVVYEQNYNNRFDFDNYLHYKPINLMDIIRRLYFQFLAQQVWQINNVMIILYLNLIGCMDLSNGRSNRLE
ncbi:unnamed protein product [Paramecium sonneborni]|uniref:Uncharacterized protein n=1 Tax=Paramecium sonneborni TaxID=65129 RepID=A0A8S1R5R0_9CILI|nr:unnamed protein product [Paramecium sonneborni]